MKESEIVKNPSQNECGCTQMQNSSCCSGEDNNIKSLKWIIGNVKTPLGPVKKISGDWSRKDSLEQIKSRISSFRRNYTVDPGLYAIGDPDENSDIFVSANYKLSFDILRKELHGLNAWIIVLDTKGINVWCAAGKGTFGTKELISKIKQSRIANIVRHKKIIVPQLGAPGIDSPQVKRITGFRILFGPVRASDIKEYIHNGYKATEVMRTVKFTMWDRFILTPMELIPVFKKLPLFALIIFILFGLTPAGIIFKSALLKGSPYLIALLAAALAGAFLTPVLLPYIPFRSFSIKGWIMGIVTIGAIKFSTPLFNFNSPLLTIALFVFFPLLSSYIALQFTGASTYTNISGVKREIKIGLPFYISGTIASLVIIIFYKLFQWSIL